MPGKGCGKGGHRRHTPITSEKQRGLMGADYARAKRGQSTRTGMSKAELKRHLEEAGGKDLPKKAKKKR